jgi:hypothetical protein
MPVAGIKQLKWTHRFVAVFKCYRGQEDPKREMVAQELKVATESEIKDDANLTRVLGALQSSLVDRRMYLHADKPTTRLLAFSRHPEEGKNEGRALLDALLAASDKEAVHQQAVDLAERYRKIPNVNEGILIFLIARGSLGTSVSGNCVFVFKCNFEAISQITPDELFRKIEDAIVEQTKKGALYPYFDRGRFDEETIRVFDEQGETQYWLDFLDLGERLPVHEMMHEATLMELPEKLAAEYGQDFKPRPSIRPLADKERSVKSEHRLSPEEARGIIDAVAERAGEPWVKLWLDDVRVEAPLHQYLDTWILAEEAGECYVLIKGSNLEIRTPQRNPLDIVELTSLKEAAAKLGLSLA